MSRKCISGAGVDTTAAWKTYLQTSETLLTRFIFLIGDPEDPNAIWATDHETPLNYQLYGTFYPATISKTGVTYKLGLDVQTMTITWTPNNRTWSANTSTASPYQLAALHYYDMKPVKVWKVYMPTPGDCNSIGAVEWFGGVISTCRVSRSALKFNCKNQSYAFSQKVPNNVIEVTNTLAGYTVAVPPSGSNVPVFSTFTGSSENVIYGDVVSPDPGHIYDKNTFNKGYMIFLSGSGSTLSGAWSVVGLSEEYTDGHGNHHNEFQLYDPLPWPPTPGVDTFYVSTTAPINQGDEEYYGFPYVPSPETAA